MHTLRNVLLHTISACMLCSSALPMLVRAQESLTLSVTPTLFQMSAVPGQVWKSSVKVVNSNPYPITIYAEPVNFKPQGEGGTGKFLPVFEAVTDSTTLAEWIAVEREPITIEREQSYQIPFQVLVPDDAAPGGHFAAIVISTKPPETTAGQVSTSQAVTSLFFVRLAGDVLEEGVVREFTTAKRIAQQPDVGFVLRFENKGNVHLQPQGEIRIYNMWGEERGVIPINQDSNFGNVLPESIRRFNFNWIGESAFTEIGRYKAELTLGYGENGRKFVTSNTYFWVVPIKEVLLTLGAVLGLVLFVVWAIRAYVRRMLLLAGVDPRTRTQSTFRTKGTQPSRVQIIDENTVRIGSMKTVGAPVRSGVKDLQERVAGHTFGISWLRALGGFIVAYKLFFLAIVILVIAGILGYLYVVDATTDQRAYEVTIENPDADITISSEEILYNRMVPQTPEPVVSERTIATSTPVGATVNIVNVSGIPGTGASLRRYLEDRGYHVDSVRTEFGRIENRTVIIFPLDKQDAAVELSKRLDNALLSATAAASTTEFITVFVGSDFDK